jgi:dTDP-4-amino-4,6-dideoxygalactose transaminase
MKITAPLFDDHEIENLKECLSSGWVTQGPFTAEFEKKVCAAHQLDYGFAVTSCTAALHIAAHALGLGPGDEVIVPAFTWITSANTAEYVGAKVVFVDVEPETFNLDPKAVERAITPNTKAIVAVHLFGLAAPMDELKAIADAKGIAIIEDAACAIGTTYKGRFVGAIGDIGCFSFHPRKAVTTGEGGLVSTNNPDLAKLVTALRNHGSAGPKPEDVKNPKPWSMGRFPYLGFNYRLSDIQAAVGCAQMQKLDGILASRRECATRYDALLKDFDFLATPADPYKTQGHAYQSYVLRVTTGGHDLRNKLMMALAEKDIQTRPGTHAVHRLAYYADKYGLSPDDFPNASLCEDTTITLPIFPGMTEDDQALVASIIKNTANSAI